MPDNIINDNINIHKYQSLDSTNNKAKELAENGAPSGTVVVADMQTSGRGRLGRTFESPDNAGLYMSILLRPNLSEHCMMLITTAAAVAVTRALQSLHGIDAEIKWVNDICARGRKLCGILAEGLVNPQSGKPEAVVLGIGINLKVPSGNYAESIKDIAISVEEIIGTAPALREMQDALALAIAENVLALTANDEVITSPSLLAEYRERSCVIGRSVLVYKSGAAGAASIPRPAKALDIADNGGLSVIYSDGSREILTSGEITIRFE